MRNSPKYFIQDEYLENEKRSKNAFCPDNLFQNNAFKFGEFIG